MDKRTIEQKKAALIQELKQCYGIKTLACRRARVGRTSLYAYLKADLDFALKVKEIEEGFTDYVETRLLDLVKAGDRAAIMFYLKAKAKDRGYK